EVLRGGTGEVNPQLGGARSVRRERRQAVPDRAAGERQLGERLAAADGKGMRAADHGCCATLLRRPGWAGRRRVLRGGGDAYWRAIAAAPPRSTYFWILPVAVLGRESTTC